MTTPKPSGLKAPSKIAKGTGLPQPKSGIPPPGHRAQSALAKSARAAGLTSRHAEEYAAEVIQILPGPEEAEMIPQPADDFIIGERVWVGGTKPGQIAFLGETDFASGEWAGVVLDEPLGKNDGSVNGHRYFQCESNRGLFARVTKLLRTPVPKAVENASNGMGVGGLASLRATTPKLGVPGSRGSSGSTASLNKISPPTSSLNLAKDVYKHNFKVGDRVLVSGTKAGTLRYIGQTDFAKGDWAGVELDDMLGKNDGAVAGKRYFDCNPQHGLFAPIHKVTKLPLGTNTPSPQARSLANMGMRLSREKSGSQESVSSISSSASSVSRSRAKAGQRPSSLNLSATTSALQKALKEKQEHIEQLLRERDLERSEVARAAAKVEEAEGQLAVKKSEVVRFREESEDTIIKLKTRVRELEQDKKELSEKLEDEKRKIEDLQFQIEEEVISKDDLESKTEEEEARLKELDSSLRKEQERGEKYEKEAQILKNSLEAAQNELKTSEKTQTLYLDQVELLTHKLSQAENKIKTYETSKLEDGAKTSQVSIELSEKTARVMELEDSLSNKCKDLKQVEDKLSEMEDELKSTNSKREKLQDVINDLTEKLESSHAAIENLNSEMQELKSQLSDMHRNLDSSKERGDQLAEDKAKLEQQMAEVMKNSGDSSQQLSLLNEQLRQRDRKIEELQADLSNSTQRIGKLSDTTNQLQEQRDKEKSIMNKQHEEAVTKLEGHLEDVKSELGKAQSKIMKISMEYEEEKADILQKKETEVGQLKQQLEVGAEKLDKEQQQNEEHRCAVDELTAEKETLQFEKEKLEKQLRWEEEERDTVNRELSVLKEDIKRHHLENEKAIMDNGALEEQLEVIQKEKEKALKEKEKALKSYTESKAEKCQAVEERSQLQQELTEVKARLQQKEIEVEEQQNMVVKLQEQLADRDKRLSSTEQEAVSSSNLVIQQLEEANKKISELHLMLEQTRSEKETLSGKLEISKIDTSQQKELGKQNTDLRKQLEETDEKYRAVVEDLVSQKSFLTTELAVKGTSLVDKDLIIEEHRNQIEKMKDKNQELSQLKASFAILEQTKEQLTEKIKSLEKELVESKAVAHAMTNGEMPENSIILKLKENLEESEKNIEFLKSEIVFVHQKNEKLKLHIETLESGDVKNGDAEVEALRITSTGVSLRAFCDICDEFDLHETEDCPKQAMSDSPPCTQYHGNCKEERPYCEICEGGDASLEGTERDVGGYQAESPTNGGVKVQDDVPVTMGVALDTVVSSEGGIEVAQVQDDVPVTMGVALDRVVSSEGGNEMAQVQDDVPVTMGVVLDTVVGSEGGIEVAQVQDDVPVTMGVAMDTVVSSEGGIEVAQVATEQSVGDDSPVVSTVQVEKNSGDCESPVAGKSTAEKLDTCTIS